MTESGEQSQVRPLLVRIVAGVLVALGLFGILSNTLTFGGDPEIHLIFAKNALAGHPLQFNLGEYSSGETSPLYMLILAAIMAATGLFQTAVAMKLIGVTSAVALVLLLRRELRRSLGTASPMAALLPWALLAMPSLTFQAQLGMENMPFALGMAWLQVESTKSASRRRFSLLTLASVLLFFLRPEAIFLMLFRLGVAVTSKADRIWRVLALVFGAMTCVGLVWLLEHTTGVPLYGAGMSRALISQFDIPPWSAISTRHFSTRPIIYCAYAWPMLLVVALRWRRVPSIEKQALIYLVFLPLGLHFTNVFPNVHFSRYALYFWFPTLHAFVAALAAAQFRLGIGAFVLSASTLCVGCVDHLRREQLNVSSNKRLLQTWEATRPGSIARISNQICELVQCEGRPIVIAAREVQIRMRLDDRFIVRSLDGIVDHRLTTYVHEKGIDYLGYFSERKVDIVMNWTDRHSRALQPLTELARQAMVAPVRIGNVEFRVVGAADKPPYRVLRRTLSPVRTEL